MSANGGLMEIRLTLQPDGQLLIHWPTDRPATVVQLLRLAEKVILEQWAAGESKAIMVAPGGILHGLNGR